MAVAGGGAVALPPQVTVHVFDADRNISKDFNCEAGWLLSNMKYFARFFAQNHPVKSSGQVTQSPRAISVHCDVDVFDKLLGYCKARARGQGYVLSDTDTLPMLIAGNFLQMEELVHLCLQYISSRLKPVALLASDLTMLPADLFLRLAQITSESALEGVHSAAASGEALVQEASSSEAEVPTKKQLTPEQIQHLQQLVNRLYKHKLEVMLKELRTTVVRCVHCGAMYSLADKQKIACTARSPAAAGPSGAPPAPPTHEPDPAWRLQDHLAALRGLPAGNKPDSCPAAPVASWRDIYWDVWGVVHVLYCHHCLQYFPAQELALCSFHPEPPIFTVGRSTGRYPCCGGHAARSGAMQLFSAGCCAREHQVLPTSSAPPVTASLAAAGTSKAGAVGNLPERMAGDWATLHAFRHLIVPEPAAWNMIELRSDGSEEEEDGEEGEEEGAGPGPLSAAARRQGQQGRSHSARAQGSRDSAAGQFSMYKQQSRVTQSARSPSKQAAGSTGGGGGVGDARSRPSPTRSGAHNQAAGAARRQLSGSFSASGRFEGLDNSADSRHGGAALEAASAVASLDAGGGSSSTSGAGALSAIAPRLGGLSGASASVQQAWLAGVEGQQSPRGQQQPVQPVKVVPLSALGSVAGGGGYSPSHGFGGPGSHVSRKLRLELLHEDDMSRMDALIAHLAACRPSRVKAGLQAAAAAGSAQSQQQGSQQPSRATSVGRQPGAQDTRRSGSSGYGQSGSQGAAGPKGPERSISATRGGMRIVPNATAGHGAAGRPVSAPRMRPGTAQAEGRGGPSAAQLRRLPSANVRPPLYI